MSNTKLPFQVVLKPGVYQSGNTKGGLNLNKWIPKFLKRIGFANTVDCCTYYPTYPQVNYASFGNPTEEEMDAAGIPIWGFFLHVEGELYYLFVRVSATNTNTISNNN